MSELKEQVRDYWNRQSCGTGVARADKYSREYFDEIEDYRYTKEPEIFAFAQFTRFHGRRVLEVGVGAGTDFIQWVRAGAQAWGIDLTEEAVEHVRHRLSVYGLQAREVLAADAESLPYPDDSFDLVYSWGVIHHTPDTSRALCEIVRVTRPGGMGKVMVYNRRSLAAVMLWLRVCLLAGRPWRSIAWALYHHMESPGTKAFTAEEIRRLLDDRSVRNMSIRAPLTLSDGPQPGEGFRSRMLHLAARGVALALGWSDPGWFIQIEFEKAGSGTEA